MPPVVDEGALLVALVAPPFSSAGAGVDGPRTEAEPDG